MAKKPSEDVEKRAADFVLRKSQEWRDASRYLRDKWLVYYQLYRKFETKGRQPWQSKLFIPKAFEVVEKVTPRLTAQNPQFIAVPKKASATGFTSIIQDYLQFVWEEERLKEKLRLWVKSALIYGTAFVKIDWKSSTRVEQFEQEGLDEEGDETIETVQEEMVVNEIPTLELVDIFDIDIDPTEPNVQEAFGIVHNRDNVLLDSLDDDTYFNLDKVQGRTVDPDKKTQQESFSPVNETQDQYVSIKEYWGLFDPKDDGDYEEYVITVANGVLIRYEKNPFATKERPKGVRPFVAVHDQPVPDEFYAIGEIEPIVSLQEEMNAIRNQRMDNVNLGLNQIWRVDPDSGINPSQVVSEPGRLIFARQGEIEPMFHRDVPVSGYQEAEAINRDIQTATGTIDFTQDGGSQSFTNTATGERIRANEANSRYQYKLENVEMAVAEVGKIMLQVASVFADDNIVVRFADDDGNFQFDEFNVDVFKSVVDGFDVRIEAGSTGLDTVEDRRNNAIALGNLSLQYKNAGVPVDLSKNYIEIIKHFSNVKNPQSMLGAPEELPPEEAPQPQAVEQPVPEIAPTNQFI